MAKQQTFFGVPESAAPVRAPGDAHPASVNDVRAAGAQCRDGAGSKVPIRILMVDDHAMMRASLRMLLEQYCQFQVVGEAADRQQTLDFLQENTVDIILLDLLLKNETGLDLLPLLQQIAPQARIILLTGWRLPSLHPVSVCGRLRVRA